MPASLIAYKNLAGTVTLFEVFADGSAVWKDEAGTTILSLTAAGLLTPLSMNTTGVDDFGAAGIKSDVIAESTLNAGVTMATLIATVKQLGLATAVARTIASGAIAYTSVLHAVDTEAAAASDDLDSITGGAVGKLCFIRSTAAARNVVLKHAIGANLIACHGGRDITLDVLTDWALLAHNGTQWTVQAYSTLTDGMYAAAGTWSGLQTFSHASGLATDVITERTPAAGVTADGVLLKDGHVQADNILSNNLVKATCTGADSAAGVNTLLMSVQLNRMDGSTAITAARQVQLWAGATQGAADGPVPNASLSLGTVTAGSVISGSQGVWLIETSAAGLFACTATNTDDETVYWSVCTPPAGVSDLTKAALVVGTNSDGSTWGP